MIIYRVPILAYFNNETTNYPLTTPIYASNFLISKYRDISGSVRIFANNYTAEQNVDPISVIKAEVGDNLLIRNIPVYINDPSHFHNDTSLGDMVMSKLGFNPTYGAYGTNQNTIVPTEVFSINDGIDFPLGSPTGPAWYISYIENYSPYGNYQFNLTTRATSKAGEIRTESGLEVHFVIDINVYHEGIMNTRISDLPDYPSNNIPLQFTIGVRYKYKIDEQTLKPELDYCCYCGVNVRKTNYLELKAAFRGSDKINGIATTETDSDNPYGNNGVSGMGGGDGHYGDIDSIDGTPIPDLPSISAAELGFITIYNPSRSQLFALSDFLWSGLFDLDTYKKLFSDPMQSIIGLAIVPVAPTIAGNKNVMFGTIDSGVSMPYLSTQYVQFNCGDVTIEDYVGSFLDYSPYTKISIYLPYIGIHELSPDDIMNDTINVTYNIDVLSGACGAFISSAKKGVLYSYNGSCISNIPLTSINFSSAIQNAVSAVCSGAAMIAGVVTEAAPLTAAGAIGLLGNGANAALNSKPSVQRSGSLGGSAGVLSVQKPYIIIERPNLSVPANVQRMVGQCSNITAYLGELSGFTMVEYVHIEGIPATDEEIKEIEALLKEGVIL